MFADRDGAAQRVLENNISPSATICNRSLTEYFAKPIFRRVADIREFKQRQRGRRRERPKVRENPKGRLRMTGGKRVNVLRSVPT